MKRILNRLVLFFCSLLALNVLFHGVICFFMAIDVDFLGVSMAVSGFCFALLLHMCQGISSKQIGVSAKEYWGITLVAPFIGYIIATLIHFNLTKASDLSKEGTITLGLSLVTVFLLVSVGMSLLIWLFLYYWRKCH